MPNLNYLTEIPWKLNKFKTCTLVNPCTKGGNSNLKWEIMNHCDEPDSGWLNTEIHHLDHSFCHLNSGTSSRATADLS